MTLSILNKHINFSEKYLNSIKNIEFDFKDKIKPLELIHNGKIHLGGSLGKKTLINEDYRIILFFENTTDKDSQDLEEEVTNKMKGFIPNNFTFEIQEELSIVYRYKYVIKFITGNPQLSIIIQILKIWNKNRKIGLEEIILELIACESIFRTNLPDSIEKEMLKTSFQTLHNAMEGISIIPRNWYKFEEISAPVSNSGIKIVDPGDPTNNLANNLTFEQDLKIRNECLRAISILADEKIEELLDTIEN